MYRGKLAEQFVAQELIACHASELFYWAREARGSNAEVDYLVVREGQAVISPSWSIHAGAGTSAYSFIWGMGGENQEFDDMDGVNFERIR